MGRGLLTAFACFFCVCNAAGQIKTQLSLGNGDGSDLHRKIEVNVSAFLTECNMAASEKRALNWQNIFATAAAKERINTLWEGTSFRCVAAEISENLLKVPGSGFQVRNVALTIADKEGENKQEDAVVQITAAGEIEDLYFGIEQHKYKEILRQGVDLKDFRRRQMILDFLENFRTAYNRKDLPLIQSTFSDNALIIVGKVLSEKVDAPDYMSSLGKKKVELVRYNKQQYMSNLKKSFESNKFIDVRFSEIEIVKHGVKEDIYGVKLMQQWRSSSYSDSGFLFLMVDFEDEQHPLIHVRAWQPEKDTELKDVIELGDFDVIK
ncbi:MAG: hypothetical protein ACK5B6_02415 [Bacteroidia bacterium]|jgi:hypothetical protein